MAIFQVIKDGIKEVVTQDSTQFNYKPDGKTKSYAVQRIMYKQESWIPPAFTNMGGKKYLLPKWVEVHPETQFSDILWKRPKPKVRETTMITKKFTSKSNPDITYEARKVTLPTGEYQYSCNCPGVWRAKDRRCKHIKDLES